MPKRGFASKGTSRGRLIGGTARRLPLVVRQLRLTYDLDGMEPERIVELLPAEFDRWREASGPSSRCSRPRPIRRWGLNRLMGRGAES